MKKTTIESRNPDIPQFALYGETAFTHKPEFVHIEDIHERSSRNGWVIRPHRHTHLYQILCMFSGEAQVQLDAESSVVKGSQIIISPASVVHGFRFSTDIQGVVLSLAVNMLGLDAENQVSKLLQGSLSQARIFSMPKNSALNKELRQYLTLIRNELAMPQAAQSLALFSLVKLALLTLQRHLLLSEQKAVVQDAGVQLSSSFRALLEQHYREHWLIADYADALHVSVSTLNRACQQVLGSTAKKLIQERLHIEAKRRLIYTRETLEQIAFDLGFKDAAYFSRVFKQLEDMSPKSFRLKAEPG